MNPRPLRPVDLHSDAGRLEGLYRDIENPAAVAVVCHPLPTHGGTLHSKVVFRAARGLEAAGVATIRFNFRGVGTSQGSFDSGEGERRDAEAAIQWISRKHPSLPIFAGGFSFGSWVATRAGCDNSAVKGLFLVGAPVNKYDLGYLRDCAKPKLFLQGSEDEFGSMERLTELMSVIPNAETFIVSGAGHFFEKQLDVVQETLREWALRVLEE